MFLAEICANSDFKNAILEAMSDNNVQLVNNEGFLDYAAVTPNPVGFPGMPPIPPEPLTAAVKGAFLTEGGATPLDNVEDLKGALRILWRYRADLWLEAEAVFDLPMFPDISTCSDETYAAGNDILDDIVLGIVEDLDFFNMEDFFNEMVLDFVRN